MQKLLLPMLLATSLLFAQDNGLEQRANEAAGALLKRLGGELIKHLKSKGAVDALKFCNANAPRLTQEVNRSLGKKVKIKRISLRPRNQANTPSKEEAKILEQMEALLKSNKSVTPVSRTKDGYYIYYKPLFINKKACLICHGDIEKNPKLAKTIKKLYPNDKATHYKMGDLRGAVVVKIDLQH